MEEDIKILEEFAHDLMQDYIYSKDEIPKSDIRLKDAIQNLIAKYKELEEYKKDAELTKIVCCVAQNCEALNNCIRLERENAELKTKLQKFLEA